MRNLILLGLSLALASTEAETTQRSCDAESSIGPGNSGRPSTIEFANRLATAVNVYLRNETRQRLFVRKLAPGERFAQNTIESQPFVVTDASGRCLEIHQAKDGWGAATIEAAQPAATASGPIIQTYAGTDWTFQADGQPALNAPIGATTDLTFDSAGNLYITDNLNYQIYRVDTNGTLRVIAGNGFDSS